MKTRPILGLLTASLLIAAGLHAAEPAQTKTMLVLDASGSMWGQIGGKTKIAIAREAVDSMLDGWNGGDLGLIAYGHRRKGDCADIEVLQAIGPDTAAGIRKQVNALNPKGMTPITASVRMAAEQLRFTEQKATVILVSDGRAARRWPVARASAATAWSAAVPASSATSRSATGWSSPRCRWSPIRSASPASIHRARR